MLSSGQFPSVAVGRRGSYQQLPIFSCQQQSEMSAHLGVPRPSLPPLWAGDNPELYCVTCSSHRHSRATHHTILIPLPARSTRRYYSTTVLQYSTTVLQYYPIYHFTNLSSPTNLTSLSHLSQDPVHQLAIKQKKSSLSLSLSLTLLR